MFVFNLHNFIEKKDFGPPSKRCIFCIIPWVFEWKRFFGVLAISDQKSIFVDRYNETSIFRRTNKFQEATSLEPVQSRLTFRLHVDPPNGVEKWPAAAQARVKLLLEICNFLVKSIFHCTCRQKSTFGLKSRAPQKRRFHVKTWGVVQKMKRFEGGPKSTFLIKWCKWKTRIDSTL